MYGLKIVSVGYIQLVCYRIIKFAESHYTTPAHIEHLEDRGLQGDEILVEGIRTGSANVKSVIKDPVYKVTFVELHSYCVLLRIVDSISLICHKGI